MSATAAFLCAYLVWVFIIAFYGGFWVYPILKKLDTVQGWAVDIQSITFENK
jgi:uncharacterized membrane protein (DUF485 family)